MNTAIIIHSCDKYNYILPEFFKHFNKFRPQFEKLGLSTWLTTEEIDSSSLCANILTGKGAWSTRLKFAINTFPSHIEHIILLQEDFFFINVDFDTLYKTIIMHDARGHDITKFGSFFEFSLVPLSELKRSQHHNDINGHIVYKQIGGHYTMSHQPIAIFERNFLLQTLEKPRDPWEHECDVTKEINLGDPKGIIDIGIYTVGKIYNPNRSDIITTHHAIRKGVYYPL